MPSLSLLGDELPERSVCFLLVLPQQRDYTYHCVCIRNLLLLLSLVLSVLALVSLAIVACFFHQYTRRDSLDHMVFHTLPIHPAFAPHIQASSWEYTTFFFRQGLVSFRSNTCHTAVL